MNQSDRPAPWRTVIAAPAGSLQRLLAKRDQRARPTIRLRPARLALPVIVVMLLAWVWFPPSPRAPDSNAAQPMFSSPTHAALEMPSAEPNVHLVLLMPRAPVAAAPAKTQ